MIYVNIFSSLFDSPIAVRGDNTMLWSWQPTRAVYLYQAGMQCRSSRSKTHLHQLVPVSGGMCMVVVMMIAGMHMWLSRSWGWLDIEPKVRLLVLYKQERVVNSMPYFLFDDPHPGNWYNHFVIFPHHSWYSGQWTFVAYLQLLSFHR